MNVKILIVDGDETSRCSLVEQLRQRGCGCVEARDLVEANHVIHAGGFDVAVINLSSLREEGLLLIRVIKHVHQDAEIIVLIEPEQIGLSIRGMRLGAFDDLMVPMDVDDLCTKIQCARSKSRENRALRDRSASGEPGFRVSGPDNVDE